ncbi:MAG: phage integrase N-terminal domain-containing protein [Rhizomicrobium sp.]
MNRPWQSTLVVILRTHAGVRRGGSVASHATRDKRGDDLFAGFRDLRKLGYKLDDVRQFKGRHMKALVQEWERRGLKPATIANRISSFRRFAEWIGKAGMIEASEHYVSDPKFVRRSSVAKVDRSWQAQGIDVAATIERVRAVAPREAMMLELQWRFKLRPSESMQLRPHLADRGHWLGGELGNERRS